mmetsp:Transcript_5728/g.7979  ORF Transcript_5728/g.7979 Transcript_5728/m.7979 type:complete len:361 (+) Transcript_5728:94-1176(+)
MMQYRVVQPDFHCFEIPGKVVGLRFAEIEEAALFSSKVHSRLQKLAKDMNERSSSGGSEKNSKGVFDKLKGWFGVKKKPKRETKQTIIGRPTDFKHEAHIGYDPNKGVFDLDSLSHEWKQIFKQAGIRKKHLRNKSTAKRIFDRIASFNPQEATVKAGSDVKSSLVSETHQQPSLPPRLPARPPTIESATSHSRSASRSPKYPRNAPKKPGSAIPTPPPADPVGASSTRPKTPPKIPEVPPPVEPQAPPLPAGIPAPPKFDLPPPPDITPAVPKPKPPPLVKKGKKSTTRDPSGSSAKQAPAESLANQLAKVQLKKTKTSSKDLKPMKDQGGMGGLRNALEKIRANFESDSDEEDDDWSD